MKIFVSYTLRDGNLNIAKLREIETLLSQYGSPYIDLLHNNSIAPQQYVIAMLKQSSIFCALWTPKLLESKWVQLEFSLALTHNIPIFWINILQKQNTFNESVKLSQVLQSHQEPLK